MANTRADNRPHIRLEDKQNWSRMLQRRVMYLLLIHDRRTFPSKFREFYRQSELFEHELLQQYDRYLKLVTCCEELLDDIMPRIRRQLSLNSSSVRTRELAPVRGDIDWARTIERQVRESAGLAPLSFDTRLRQREHTTPANLLTVAILQDVRKELQLTIRDRLGDEDFLLTQREELTDFDERLERELAVPYARALWEQAQQHSLADLHDELAHLLQPGPNPYRNLLDWHDHWQELRLGRPRSTGEQPAPLSLDHLAPSLAPTSKKDSDHLDADLYELWIALEFVHLLDARGLLLQSSAQVKKQTARAQLIFDFAWNGQHYRFRHNQELGAPRLWQSQPGKGQDVPDARPDYTIERLGERVIEIQHTIVQPRDPHRRGRPPTPKVEPIWKEPPFMMDAKYYVAGRSHRELIIDPVKKLLADMALLSVYQVVLFFPDLLLADDQPELAAEVQAAEGFPFARLIQRKADPYYQRGWPEEQEIRLCQLAPDLDPASTGQAKKILSAVLDYATQYLESRPEPICEGVLLDPHSYNRTGTATNDHTALCPKRHIGPHAVDIVDTELDCLRNPKLCHIMGRSVPQEKPQRR